MKYDPIQEEKKWWSRGEINHKAPRPLPAKHHFAHTTVRSSLYDTSLTLRCNDNSSILDVGCSSGNDSVYVQKASKGIVGIDISNIALTKFKSRGFDGVVADQNVNLEEIAK